MNLDQIYQMLVEKTEETGSPYVWVDVETNTLWMLGDEGEILRFYVENRLFKDMTEKEINEVIKQYIWINVEDEPL